MLCISCLMRHRMSHCVISGSFVCRHQCVMMVEGDHFKIFSSCGLSVLLTSMRIFS